MAGDMTGQISNWAGGGASVTLGAAQYLIGRHNDKKNKRPDYVIPREVYQNKNLAQQQAMEGLPEETMNQYMANLERGTAYGLRDLSRNNSIAGVGRLNDSMNMGYANIVSMDAQARQAHMAALMEQNQNVANYQDQAFQLNQLNPYYENKAKDQAMMGAGMQNMSQGFQSSNSGYDWGAGNKDQKSQMQVVKPASGNNYYTPNQNSPDGSGMQNYNPNSQNGSLWDDGYMGYTG